MSDDAADTDSVEPAVAKKIREIKSRAPTLFVVMKKLPGRDLTWVIATLNIPKAHAPTSSVLFLVSSSQAKHLEKEHQKA